MSARRVLLRRARRLALRSPGRTVSTGILVTVVVAVGTVLLAETWGAHVAAGSVESMFGRADALYTTVAQSSPRAVDATVSAIADAQPAGSRSATVERVVDLSTPAAPGQPVVGFQAPWTDDLLDGVLHVVDGRMPRRGEVVLSPRLADETGVRPGDRFTLDRAGRALSVVGIGWVADADEVGVATGPGDLTVDPAPGSWRPQTDATVRVGLPAGALPASVRRIAAASPQSAGQVAGPFRRRSWTGVDRPGDAPVTTALLGPTTTAVVGGSPGIVTDTPGDAPLTTAFPDGSPVGTESSRFDAPTGAFTSLLVSVFVAVALTAGAAFGIGTSRRLRATGLLAANGADRGQLTLAAAAEALVVAVPAAVVGAAVGGIVPWLWIRLHLPGWVSLVEAVVPVPWVLVLVVVSAIAAAFGAVAFSRTIRSTATTRLLDGRRPVARRRPGQAWVAWVVAIAVAVPLLGWLNTIVRGWFAGGALVSVALLVWAGVGVLGLWVARRLLQRDAMGRLVARDVQRHWVGSVAALVVVSTWVFVAVAGTATDWFRLPESASSTGTADEATTGASVDPTGSGGGFVIHGPDVGSESADPAADLAHLEAVRGRLAAAGQATSTMTIGRWTGPCGVCPPGFVPTVAVLPSARGFGLPDATVQLLESGAAVTPFPGVEQQTVAGVPLREGDVPLGVNAIVLASSVTDGSQLADPAPALIGSGAGMTEARAKRIAREVGREGAVAESWSSDALSDALGLLTEPTGSTESAATGPSTTGLWAWFLLLVVGTLAVTAAHRREHGDVARVLQVLGAGPRAGRRLASLTAGTLAAVGVGLGLTATALVIVVGALHQGGDQPFDGLWSVDATLLLVASVLVPVVVAVLARLIPAARSTTGPDGPMPA